tara:strand:- start:1852 stop:2022 length:171 start_codon:yes stop_codon:yes gene_type:complete
VGQPYFRKWKKNENKKAEGVTSAFLDNIFLLGISYMEIYIIFILVLQNFLLVLKGK